MCDYSRRVSNNERFYLAVERVTPGFCVELVVEASGEITESDLSAAVEEVARANPGCRLVLEEGRWLRERWVAKGPPPPVRSLAAAPGRAWRSEEDLPRGLQRPLPPQGPTCEVVVCPGAPFRLVFRAFHGVMDGGGLLYWVHEVFRALRGEPLQGSRSSMSDTDIVRALGGTRTRPWLPFAYRSATGRMPSIRPGVVWQRTTVSGQPFGLAAKASVGIARHARSNGVERVRVMVPVDLRHDLRSLATTGNASYPIFVDVVPAQSWQTVHSKILRKLAGREALAIGTDETCVGYAPSGLLALATRAHLDGQWLANRFQLTASVVHIPRLDAALLSAPALSCQTVYFIPAPSRVLPLAVAALSRGGETELTVSAPRSLADEQELGRLSRSIVAAVGADVRVREKAG
jgi:hypothetical protein